MNKNNLKNLLSINSIKVTDLFGYYSYTVNNSEGNISKLLILYGDNGSGKTTILNLVFWLLSSKDRSGYKSKISATKFKEIEINFENGVTIGAHRQKDKLVGDFIYYFKEPNRRELRAELKSESTDYSIKLKENTDENTIFLNILNRIRELKVTLFYLADDRKVSNSLTSSNNEDISYEVDLSFIRSTNIQSKKINEKGEVLERAFEKFIEWIKTQTIDSSKTGEKNSQVIYMDLINNISTQAKKIPISAAKASILEEITYIKSTIIPYIKLGLIDDFDSVGIISAIKRIRTNNVEALVTIITPYLNSFKAKLNALKKLKDTIELFLLSINDYFSNKTLSFDLKNGFKLMQNQSNEVLGFDMLSSGERQLLLLFINIIVSTDEATIFLIDEPEISLNVKWQRKLMDTLLAFTEEKNIQYIIATHSLEVLANNLDKVIKLESYGSVKKKI